MKRYLPFLFAVLMVACVAPENRDRVANRTATTPVAFEATLSASDALFELVADTAFRFKNLQVFPIVAEANYIAQFDPVSNYLNLKEALKKQAIHIHEVGASTNRDPLTSIDMQRDEAEVNRLVARNRSGDTIFVMAGEVIQGGKQDRVVSEDFVLLPGQQEDIGVFCVEQNRWVSQNGSFSFTGHYGLAANSLRKTMVTSNDQREVWAQVDEVTSKNRALSETKTYTNLGNSRMFLKKSSDYYRHFNQKLTNIPNMVGLIAVSGDQVLGCDIFHHPELMQKQLPMLLQSYVTDAVTNRTPVDISAETVATYFDTQLERLRSEQAAGLDWQKLEQDNFVLHFAAF
ncbi:MAG: DUF6569 family protein [Bacteroidota bacterium]